MIVVTKDGTVYQQWTNGTLTCGPLDQSGKLGGTGEEYRNEIHNPTRFLRIQEYHHDPKVLDFGCGTGKLVEFLRSRGIEAVGFDKFAPAVRKGEWDYIYTDMDAFEVPFDVVTMIEVIEHTAAPYEELDQVFKVLKPGGILMIETSFTDWMDLETDPYINPRIGHSTIFSHAGLDELMKEKGFEVYGHINQNVRVYQKPGAPVFAPKITLVTMGQANPKALKKTIESFKDLVDEIVFGDLLIFDQDREAISHYTKEYNFRMIKLPFNYIFKNGFSATLNQLAEHAHNDWILYMNVSEVMDGEHPVKAQMSEDYNCYSFDHASDPHRWYRLYNKREIRWGGMIHEEVIGDLRPCPFNVFRMKDEEKDIEDPFYARVANDVKEICYWAQYLKLVAQPELRGTTNEYWIKHAEEAHTSYVDKMRRKGRRVEAFAEGNLTMYLEEVYTNPEFEQERFESSELINFQGDRKLL